MLTRLQRFFIFPRQWAGPVPPGPPALEGLVPLEVPSEAGPVEGWLLVGQGRSAARPGPAVIFGHGNAELIDHWPAELEPYRQMGLSVLLPEYRGYGRSPGAPSEAAITADLVRFHDLLATRPEVDRTRIVLHGRSIGGGAVCALARARPPAALVLQSTFTSLVEVARRFLLPGFLVKDRFENRAVVETLTCPVLILHGDRDELIPFGHAEALQAAARAGRLVTLPGGDHNICPSAWPGFWAEVRRLLVEAKVLDG